MKKYVWSLLLLFSLALIACDDDEINPSSSNPPGSPNNPSTPDSTKPVINLTSPVDNSNVMVIEILKVIASIQDNSGVKEVRIFLFDSSGTKELFNGIHNFNTDDNSSSVNFGIFERFSLGTVTGTYKLILEAEDKKNNIAKDSIVIEVTAPDLNEEEFSHVFTNNGYIANYMFSWDYTPLVESELILGLMYVIDRDEDDKLWKAEWEKFIADFGISHQNWASWDANSDGFLTKEEFGNGFSIIKLFHEWDQNKDAILSQEEFARGVFGRWDSNKNGNLSRKEYEEKVHAYFF